MIATEGFPGPKRLHFCRPLPFLEKVCYTDRIAIGWVVGGAAVTTHRQTDELREFMIILRRALLMIVNYIEKRYNLPS